MKSARSLFVAFLVAVSLGAALNWSSSEQAARANQKQLRATGELKWFKGNMHTHSLWSDGDNFLENIAQWYQEHDYQFLVYTDHNTLANKERWVDVEKAKSGKAAYDSLKKNFPAEWINERKTADGKLEVRLKTFEEVAARFNKAGQYLLVQGEEVTDSFGKSPIHMNASNVKEVLTPRKGTSVADTIQNNTDALIAQRERTGQAMMIHLNHPNFGWGVTAEDLMAVRGENFFEVYNGHPGVNNSGDKERAGTERMWDIINTRRLTEFDLPLLYGLATDDGHNYHKIPSRASEPGRGWVVVLAPELSPTSLIDSLEHGRFYASSGVALESVTTSDAGLEVQAQPTDGVTYRIEFIGTRKGFDAKHEPYLDKDGKPLRVTEKYSADIGKVLATVEGGGAQYKFEGDELYVRARVTSSRKHPNPSELGEFERAWTQPLAGPGAKKK